MAYLRVFTTIYQSGKAIHGDICAAIMNHYCGEKRNQIELVSNGTCSVWLFTRQTFPVMFRNVFGKMKNAGPV